MAIAIGGNSVNKAYLGTTAIQKMYLGVDLVFDNSIQPSELTPIITNFRVEDANKDRVYFYTPLGYPDGMTTTGFVISQKTISLVTKVDDNGGYFTVSSAFDFWDNNTIRLGEVTDTSDSQTVLYNFTLEDIDNNIPEPNATGDTYFVNVGATGNGSGDSESNGFTTLQAGFNAATGNGDIIYMKAGTYTTSSHTETNSFGSSDANNPVKLIGYKTTPGDLDGVNYYSYTRGQAAPALDPSEMPLMEGNNVSAWAIQIEGTSNTIIKNIQFHAYRASIRTLASGSSNIAVDNCISDYMMYNTNEQGSGIVLESPTNTYSGFRITNCISMNAGMSNIAIQGSGCRISNCNTYSDNATDDPDFGADYQINVRGSNNIITNCLIETLLTGNREAHALTCRSLYSDGELVYHNLFQHIELNVQNDEAMQARNPEVKFNVFKDIQVTGYDPSSTWGIGMRIQSGANSNVFERIEVNNMYEAISFITGSEAEYVDASKLHTSNNIIRNSTFNNVNEVFRTYELAVATPTYYENNKVINCTFNNANYFYRTSVHDNITVNGNEFIDCIIEDVSTQSWDSQVPLLETFWSFEEANIHSSWATSIGTDSSNLDPQFTGDLLPTNESLMSSRDSRIRYDLNEKQREDVDTTKGAVTLASENAGTPPVTTLNYYVSNDGLDTNPGTEALPWKTLAKVSTESSTMQSTDVIGLKGGDIFYENLDLTNATAGITVQSYGTGQAKITGFESLAGFTQSGSIWTASTTGKTVNMVANNDVLMHCASHPNFDSDYTNSTNYTTVDTVTDQTHIIVDSAKGLTDLVGANIFIFTEKWLLEKRTITAYNNSNGAITIDSAFPDGRTVRVGQHCWINNHSNLLSQEGDYTYSNNEVKIYSASQPTGIEIGILSGSGVTARLGGYTFDNIHVEGFNEYGLDVGAISTGLANNVTVKNCTSTNNKDKGIYSEFGTGNEFDNNTINGNWSNGVMNRESGTITNNDISKVGVLSQCGHANYTESGLNGIWFNGGLMQYNNLTDIGYHGVFAKTYSDPTINNNYIVNALLTAEDGGAIYGGRGTTITANNNILVASDVNGNSWANQGIYCDEEAVNGDFDSNVIIGFERNIKNHVSQGHTYTNNKSYNPRTTGFLTLDGNYGLPVINLTVTNNDFYQDSSNAGISIENNRDSNIDIGLLDYNKYIQPNRDYSSSGVMRALGTTNYTLPTWITAIPASNVNSIDTGGSVIGASQVVYNATKSVVNEPLTGTWYDLDGNEYISSIELQPYAGEILIDVQLSQPTNPDLITNGGMETNLDEWSGTPEPVWTADGAYINSDGIFREVLVQSNIGLEAGETYRVTWDQIRVSGGFYLYLGGDSTNVNHNTTGSISVDVVAGSSNDNISFNGSTTLESSFKNITCTKI